MTSLYPTDLAAYLDIALVFFRLLGFFLLVPVFSHQAVPATIRLLLALSLSLAIYPVVRPFLGGTPNEVGSLVAAVLRECTVGFLMGFTAYLTFEAIGLAAQFVGYQMGLGTAGLMDPQTQSQVSIWVPLHAWLTLMIFLIGDMHHELLYLLTMSFEVTRQFTFESFLRTGVLNVMLVTTGKLFWIAVQMAAPFTFLILAVNVMVGILSRLMPQMNILLFSFSITILLGFGAMYLVAPELLSFLDGTLGEMSTDVAGVLKAL